jgi:UDP-N-acetylglucosamine 2-epimerase (non-hydrolysing)
MKKFAKKYVDVAIFYPVHPNPNVLHVVEQSGIRDVENICVTNSVAYKELVYLLNNVDFVATDSGGIQEEAVSLGKRVLCLRDVTERMEGVWDGSEELVGTDEALIFKALEKFYMLSDTNLPVSYVYGDGNACKRIVSIVRNKLGLKQVDE